MLQLARHKARRVVGKLLGQRHHQRWWWEHCRRVVALVLAMQAFLFLVAAARHACLPHVVVLLVQQGRPRRVAVPAHQDPVPVVPKQRRPRQQVEGDKGHGPGPQGGVRVGLEEGIDKEQGQRPGVGKGGANAGFPPGLAPGVQAHHPQQERRDDGGGKDLQGSRHGQEEEGAPGLRRGGEGLKDVGEEEGGLEDVVDQAGEGRDGLLVQHPGLRGRHAQPATGHQVQDRAGALQQGVEGLGARGGGHFGDAGSGGRGVGGGNHISALFWVRPYVGEEGAPPACFLCVCVLRVWVGVVVVCGGGGRVSGPWASPGTGQFSASRATCKAACIIPR